MTSAARTINLTMYKDFYILQLKFYPTTTLKIHIGSQCLKICLRMLALLSVTVGTSLLCRHRSSVSALPAAVLDQQVCESNESRVRVKYILLCNSFVLSRIKSIFGMEVLWDDRHQPHASFLW